MNQDSRLYIVDGYGFVFRAYHVQPPLSAPDGTPVGALYGFSSMLLKMIGEFRPEKIIVVFDSGSKNLRHDIYPEYKANRPPAPEDLKIQLPLVREVASSLGFPTLEYEGYEADDVIATLVHNHSKLGQPTTVISSDKDLMQLIDGDMVKMYDPLKGKMITEEVVQEKFGISSTQVHDYLSLVGDSSDNIPGVPGVGAKTASILLNQFGNLENLLNNIDNIEKPRFANLMREHKDKALLSWELAKLHRNVPLELAEDFMLWQKRQSHEVLAYLRKYGFKSLESRCAKIFGAPDKNLITEEAKPAKIEELQVDLIKAEQESDITEYYKLIQESGYVAINYNAKTQSLNLSANANSALIIDFATNDAATKQGDLFTQTLQEIPYKHLIERLLASTTIRKVTYDYKQLRYSLNKLYNSQFSYNAFEDLMLMEYTLKSGTHSKNLDELIQKHNISVNPKDAFAAQFHPIYTELKLELIEKKSYSLYRGVDLPIADILFDMEMAGFKLDINALQNMSNEMSDKIRLIEGKIYKIAGEEFNIASTKQLAEILFEKMQLPKGKISGKSKLPSTGAETLEKLNESGYEIAEHLLQWRQLTKLKNTYTDALPLVADKITHKVHTCFLQATTSTSRLSSIEPNLQNIPIRTEEGAKIRQAFISAPDHKLIFADYSQIELRILSQIANISELKDAFIHNEDIHSKTAAQILKLPLEQITPEIRRQAKAINFGIIYGISAFGLAKQLGISRTEAANYIESYFAQYPGIKEYMENTKESARQSGFVTNLFGRRLYMPLINNKNHSLRSFAERAAINAPIQGTAADIAKLAMIESNKALKEQKLETKMLLQVHDELVFEAPINEAEEAQQIIQDAMQNCAANYFTIPLKVDINIRDNWSKL